ncbi:MAG: UbiA family prenyltransferase [Candidatus Zixiibacteriota bacterium]|nr:MAG: UbiA family prenyltransferase [candidate division Zixibacteria bacterium]
MIRALDFFFAARPMLLMPVWTVYLVSLHYHHEVTGGMFDLYDLLLMICLSLLCAGAFYINQVFDEESDRINGKVGFLQRGLISDRTMMTAFIIASVVVLAVSPILGPLPIMIFLQIVILSVIYSAPPVRLKDRPIGGLFANAYAHGFLVSLAVMSEITVHSADLLGWDNPVYFALTVGATYLLTTIPDMEGDRATGKRTFSVWLGRSTCLISSFCLMLLAAFVAFRSGFAPLFYLCVMATCLITASMLVRSDKAVLLAAKLPFLILTLLAGYWYPVYFLFVVALLIGTRLYYLRRFGIVYPRLA